ncbi:MAG: alanine racemase [Oscillospiraceae bacterium]
MLTCTCDLGALRSNALWIGRKTDRPLIAVLKNDAYGAGSPSCALALEPYALAFAVSSVSEATELLRAGVRRDIMTIGPLQSFDITRFPENVILSIDRLPHLREIACTAPCSRIQLRLDLDGSGIGMGEAEYQEALIFLREHRSLRLYGVFSHCPGLYRKEPSTEAARRFSSARRAARELSCDSICHLATSAALDIPSLLFDSVRSGTALFGLPSFANQKLAPLRPVLSITAPLVRIFSSREPLSLYDCCADMNHVRRAGVVAAGYGSLPALLQRKDITVAIRGKFAPLIGSSSMCHLVVDLSKIPEAREGDSAVFVGNSCNLAITAENFARTCGIPACRCEGSLFSTSSAKKIYVNGCGVFLS